MKPTRNHAPRHPLMERILPLFTDKAIAIAALLFALVLLLMLLNTASAEDSFVTKYVLVGSDSWLNIREHPKAHAAVTIRMERGEALQVYAVSKDGWAEVARAGDGGYCRVEFLCDELPDSPVAMTASVDKLRVRALPDAKATTVKKLRKGDQATVTAFLTLDGIQWAHVAGGFLMVDYLTAEGS